MKILHFDCFAGISGDMTLGAFVDLGLDPDILCSELKKLNIGGWKLEFCREERNGINGTRALVSLEEESGKGNDHHHHHHHDEEEIHDHQHGKESGEGAHAHNAWSEIRALIENSGISRSAKNRALDIFSRIARAEAAVHNKAIEDITFHEVGALDSIIDIVGAAICLDIIKPDKITCGKVELGGGSVRCAHGVLPVPAPATLILVKGMPVQTGGFDKEMTTPTGAAILASCVDEFIEQAAFTEIKSAYGIGARKLDKANVLRLSIREADSGSSFSKDMPLKNDWITRNLVLLEANVDDMNGEELSFLMERLFDAGALDTSFIPCLMKKSRPGHIISVLSGYEKLDAVRRTLFLHSSTAGFRESMVKRIELKREIGITANGSRRKTLFLDGEALRSKIEFEDRARIAREKNISLRSVDQRDIGNE
ncbi:MAG: nickel pincer cofactor biosynthesis protein LarC [Spirochaetaceae bacterium]|nr:nickel pincer cofactor biosynthesis protein LarC [Spirochaetaceae bacterium]